MPKRESLVKFSCKYDSACTDSITGQVVDGPDHDLTAILLGKLLLRMFCCLCSAIFSDLMNSMVVISSPAVKMLGSSVNIDRQLINLHTSRTGSKRTTRTAFTGNVNICVILSCIFFTFRTIGLDNLQQQK